MRIHSIHQFLSMPNAGAVVENSVEAYGNSFTVANTYGYEDPFGDNISFQLKWGSLGSKHYDRKVFNNTWGTFTFGPRNSFYIVACRGFVRIYSGDDIQDNF